MANMQNEKTRPREQEAIERAANFCEVTYTYTEQEAKNEAERCLNCKNRPCVGGCPVSVDIPEFIGEIKKGEFKKAGEIIRGNNMLPAVCGRVCPQENQCEKFCVRAIKGESVAIGRLERFAAEASAGAAKEAAENPLSSKRVAVIGSGPAGLSCAGELAAAGIKVTVYEALHTPGGVLMYGIPEFRLPKTVVKEEIGRLESLGVEFVLNFIVGKSADIDDLKAEGFDAVFIGSGAGLPVFMGIPGENKNGVYSANEFLTRINLMRAYEFPKTDTPVKKGGRVAVIGGGNVAMDAARCALRLGAKEVHIVYRRTEAEMPARAEEREHAKEEGVIFDLLTAPVRIEGDENGNVASLVCEKMQLGEPDESGRRRPRKIENSEFALEVDTVISAIGQTPGKIIRESSKNLEYNAKGCLITDESGATSAEMIYAGGDAVTGAATVILAMGAGKTAAKEIINKLKKDA